MSRYKELLLHLSSYREVTSAAAIDQAVRAAELLGARLSGLTFEIDMPVPGSPLASIILDIPGMVAAEQRRSAAGAREVVEALSRIAAQRDVEADHVIERALLANIPEVVTEYARLRDLTIMPSGEEESQQYIAECVIFGSGRPVLLLPDPVGRELSFQKIAVAWDYSRMAARALADAMPLLREAKVVRVVTIADEKYIDRPTRGKEHLENHLMCHGIDPVIEDEHAAGRPIGEALAAYACARDIDLLVMGAYGHSRFRDFILGGATKSIVAKPPLPVFLSH